MSANIKNILEELYALEPNLKSHEKEITRIIKAMMKSAPKVTIDESFREELRAKIESEIGEASPLTPLQRRGESGATPSSFGGGQGWRLGWPALSGVLACVLFGVMFYNSSVAPATTWGLISFQPEIKQVAANSFKVTNANVRPQSGGGGAGMGREMAMSNVATPAVAPVNDAGVDPVAPLNTTVATEDAIVSKMVAPDTMIYPPMDYPVYHYVYSGELNLPTEAQTVYKKTPVAFNPNETRGIITSLNVDSINLGAMSDLSVSSISLVEDREFGYMTTIDFASGNISIYQNWMKWPQPVCDMNGCNQKTLTESDIPADLTVRNAADAFLRKYNIDTSLYGEPIIDTSWRIWYERSAAMPGQIQAVPEMYMITYPFMLDGQIVYEEGGMARGLSLSYDVRNERITSFYGLEKQSLESSQYPAISDKELVNKMITQGTRYVQDREQLQPGQKIVDVALGEPKLGYLHVYGEWKNGRSDEFLVPAYIFPVTRKPDTTTNYYYTPTFITIPLVADFVQKVDYSAYPMPMPLTEPGMKEPAVMDTAATSEPTLTQ